ncbi:dihydroorotase, partial [Cryomyces antarcticus]
ESAAATVPPTVQVPPIEATASTTTAVPPPQGIASDLNLDISSFASNDLHSIPEHIGYLKEIGLDYGWGVTSTIQWTLEHVHIWTGTPWWSSIIITAVLIRLTLIRLNIKASDNAARQAAMMAITKPLTDKMTALKHAGRNDQIPEVYQELRVAYKRAGINPLAAFFPAIVQGVVGYCTFKLFRAMANLPVPGLENGGFLWLRDLTIADPIYVLPLLTAGAFHLAVRRGGESGVQNLQPMMLKFMLYGAPALMFTFMLWMPACLQLSFATASVLGILQARLLQNPDIRARLGIAPIVRAATAPAESTPPPPAGARTIDATARSRPASMDSTYEAPTVASSIAGSAPASASAGDVEGTPDKGVFQRASTSVRSTVSGARSEMAAYEERRQRELEEEQWEREDEARWIREKAVKAEREKEMKMQLEAEMKEGMGVEGEKKKKKT